MAFFCINCKTNIDAKFKACPFCGEPVTDFLRRYLESPIDGKYQILSRIGIGGMGEVYKVLHVHLNAIRVVKMMRASIMTEEGVQERFVREARLATRIQHPNVAALFDFSTLEDGSYYMVWEYIEGTNLLEQMRARGPLPPRYAARVAAQALMGLDAIHRVGVVHRDISPENLMITRDEDGEERVKIIDLGIAKQWDEANDNKTKTGMFVGKWKYCSPEHLGLMKEGERIDGRADLYSFGIVLYEMLTGVAPFQSDSPQRYLLMHATETPRPLAQANPSVHISEALEALVFRSLEKDRAKRFATAREFAKALEALIPSLDDASPAAPPAAKYEDEQTEERRVVVATQAGVSASAAALLEAATVSTPVRKSPPTVDIPLPESARTEVRSVGAQEGVKTEMISAPRPPGASATERPSWREGTATGSRKPVLFGGLAAAALAVVVVGGMLMKSESTTEVTTAAIADTNPVLALATLGINAFPWGEVISIQNLDNGKAVEIPDRIMTPHSIELPPGRYEISLQNTRFSTITRRVDLTAGEYEQLMVQFEQPSADRYPRFEGKFK